MRSGTKNITMPAKFLVTVMVLINELDHYELAPQLYELKEEIRAMVNDKMDAIGRREEYSKMIRAKNNAK